MGCRILADWSRLSAARKRRSERESERVHFSMLMEENVSPYYQRTFLMNVNDRNMLRKLIESGKLEPYVEEQAKKKLGSYQMFLP